METQTKRRFLSAFVLLLAAAFLCFGVQRGEVATVLNKAVNICLECIGLG
ncbi:CD1871A family CXXC motif-containing protein [Lacrimispora xylanolytica]|nr:CD1871A family CXXC motif-containing protein [Clostridium sp. 12(A)]